MKMKTLEQSIEKELQRYKRFEGRLALKEALKMEAYDDSPIDNQWVAEKEAEIPGLVTGLMPNHNYTIHPNEENKQIIMESLPSSAVLKGGLVAAALIIVFKILSVIRNNSAFSNGSGGGGGGRGTVTGTQQQLEKLQEVGRESKEKIEEAQRVAKDFKPNQHDEDSEFADKLRNLVDDIAEKESNEQTQPSDIDKVISAIETYDLSTIRRLLETLPLIAYIKNMELGGKMVGEFIEASDFVVDIVNSIGGGTLPKLYSRLKVSCMDISNAKDISDIEKALSIYNEISAKFSNVSLAETDRNTPIYISAKTISENIRNLTSSVTNPPADLGLELYSVDDVLKSIKDNQDDLTKVNMMGFSLVLSRFNEQFDRKFESNIGLDEKGVNEVISILGENKTYQDSVDNGNDSPELKDRKKEALRDVNMLSNAIIELVLKPLSLFRSKTDKINTFIDKLISKFEDISKSSDAVVKASTNDPV